MGTVIHTFVSLRDPDDSDEIVWATVVRVPGYPLRGFIS